QRETETLAEAFGDPVRLARVLAFSVARHRDAGDYERSIAVAQRALGFAAAIEDDALRVGITCQLTRLLGAAHSELGDYRAALGYFRRIAALDTSGVPSLGAPTTQSVAARSWASMCLAELGEFAEGTELAEDAVRAAQVTDRPWDLILTLGHEGWVHL